MFLKKADVEFNIKHVNALAKLVVSHREKIRSYETLEAEKSKY